MKPMIVAIVLAVTILSAASAQDIKVAEIRSDQVKMPQPYGAVADPFQQEQERARVAQADWESKDDALDAALASRNACDAEDQADVKETLDAKHAEISAWADYYSHHLQYHRERAKSSSYTANLRAPQRADLVFALNSEERERADLGKRINDIQETIERNATGIAPTGGWRRFGDPVGARSVAVETGNPKVLASLREMAASKDVVIQKLRRSLELFDAGSRDLMESRELAMKRAADLQALLDGLQIERSLYENLYVGMQHRLNLSCDRAMPTPAPRRDDTWTVRTAADRIKK